MDNYLVNDLIKIAVLYTQWRPALSSSVATTIPFVIGGGGLNTFFLFIYCFWEKYIHE